MRVETVFDLASLTKVIFTTPRILALAGKGAIDLDAPLTTVIPDLRQYEADAWERQVTFRQCLGHQTPFPAVEPIYTYDGDPARLRAFVLQRAWRAGPLCAGQPRHLVERQTVAAWKVHHKECYRLRRLIARLPQGISQPQPMAIDIARRDKLRHQIVDYIGNAISPAIALSRRRVGAARGPAYAQVSANQLPIQPGVARRKQFPASRFRT